MVEPFSEVGMVAQISAIQSITEPQCRASCSDDSLPTHLQDLLDQTSRDLDGTQQRQSVGERVTSVLGYISGARFDTYWSHRCSGTWDRYGSQYTYTLCTHRMSPQKIKKEEECVADMMAGGQIEPSDRPWSAPVVLVTKKMAVPGSVWTTVVWTLRLSRPPTHCPGSTIRWICWPVGNGSPPWIWPADVGRFHCLRNPGLRQHFNSKLCRLDFATLRPHLRDWWT